MNKLLDQKEFLVLRETKNGFNLYINRVKQKLVIEDGILRNDLSDKQISFIKDYVKFKTHERI